MTPMTPMVEKLQHLHPEMALFVTACVVLLLGLSSASALRKSCAWVTGIGLVIAFFLSLRAPIDTAAALPGLQRYAKTLVAGIGLLLLPLLSGVADDGLSRDEGHVRFSPARALRGEFYALTLFSLTGVMLSATADDLIWLFLALELTSLPTYVMVAVSTKSERSLESGVKYFFLGAFSAAIFLLGFAMLYGATGTTMLPEIRALIGGVDLSPLATLGFTLAILGVSFKIAAFPMHFYTADVYQGSSAAVSGFLAFAPKAAGIFTIVQLTAIVGWGWGDSFSALPESMRVLLWTMAAVTMTVGNTLGCMQTSARRILAYSSIAHSGYMLVGVIAGPGDGPIASNGLAATLFYLLTYGVMNVGAFAVLAALEKRKVLETPDGPVEVYEEVDELADLRGLVSHRPVLAWTMTLCALSLLGLPPLLGFFGKFALFTSGVSAGEIPLVIILGVNSAIAAFYYLRLAAAPMLESPDPLTERPRLVARGAPGRWIAGLVSAVAVVALSFTASRFLTASSRVTDIPAAAERQEQPRRAAHNTTALSPDAAKLEASASTAVAGG